MNSTQNGGEGFFNSIFAYFKNLSSSNNASNPTGYSYKIGGGTSGNGGNYLGGFSGGGAYGGMFPNNQQQQIWPGTSTSGGQYQPIAPTYTYYVCGYKVMKLPRKEMPKTVYALGKMVTLGILGSDCECAYTGQHLVFAPNVAEGTYIVN